jgi:hypothetical protein
MKRLLAGMAALALGMALAAGPAVEMRAAAAGVTVVPWRPFRGKLLLVDARHKVMVVRERHALHEVSLAYGVQVQLHGKRQTLSDLGTLMRFRGQDVVVAPEANGVVLVIIL